MARRICVLGNSHAASLKEAWDQLAVQSAAFDLTFFAAYRDQLSGLNRADNLLIPANEKLAAHLTYTSGGRPHVDLDAYDGFLLYGLGLSIPQLGRDLSLAVRRRCCHDVLAGSLCARVASLIRAHTGKPVYAGHEPQRAFREKERLTVEHLGYEATFDIMKDAARDQGIVLLPQPLETLVDDWGTAHRFSDGSTRLDVGNATSGELHPPREREHMNGAFGALYLRQFFDALLAADSAAGT